MGGNTVKRREERLLLIIARATRPPLLAVSSFPRTRPCPYLISSESAPLIPKKPCGIAVPPGMKPRNLVLFTFSPAVSDEIYTSGTFNTPNGGCNVFRWYDNIYECSARIYPELV